MLRPLPLVRFHEFGPVKPSHIAIGYTGGFDDCLLGGLEYLLTLVIGDYNYTLMGKTFKNSWLFIMVIAIWLVLWNMFFQWPFQGPKLEVPTIYKAYVRPM